MKLWKRTDIEVALEGWRTVLYKTFIHPDGREVRVEVVDKMGSGDANVIALTADGKVIVGRQFRCGPEKIMEELAGGAIDEDETPEHAAIRELGEELGYEPGEITYLGYVHREAWKNGISHYFLAINCQKLASGQELDGFEVIEPHLISIAELLDNAKNARMTDAGGILLAYDRLKELEKQHETTN